MVLCLSHETSWASRSMLLLFYTKQASHHTMQRLFLILIPATTYSPTNTLRSTIGDGGLNCRVRHGTGCVPSSVTTRNLYVLGCDLCCFCCPDLRLCIAVFFDALFYHISCDIGLDLDAERMKHEGGGSEGVYVIRRGCADNCFAVMRQI